MGKTKKKSCIKVRKKKWKLSGGHMWRWSWKKKIRNVRFSCLLFFLSLSPSFLFFLLHETSNTPRKNFQVALGRPASFQDLRTGASAIFVTDHLMLWNLKENVVSSSSSSEIDICRRRCDTSCFFPYNFIL